MTAPTELDPKARKYLEQAITGYWGERCHDFDKDCPCCQAWRALESLSAQNAQPQAGEPVAWRWKPKDGEIWIYDPDSEWLEEHRHKIDTEPLYASPQPANLAQVTDADRPENITDNPKSWIAWKREAERLADELARAGSHDVLTDEQIIELAVAHSNYKDGGDFEVFSHTRIVEFARHLSVLTAAIGAGGQAVAVKALEWTGRNKDGTIHIAHVVPMEYWAWELAGFGYWSWGTLSGREVHGGIEAAKAAAQADYERRIMSALSQPHPADERVVEALRIAEERLSGLLARIHRDGGHYEAAHGTEKAWADADEIVARIYADDTHPAHSPAALAQEGRKNG